MPTVQDVCDFLAEFAPPTLAEDWDNVGLLVGDSIRPARRIMTCLTVTPESVQEAVDQQADLIVSHHPFPFRPLKQITAGTITGSLLLKLIQAGIAVHSPHTAFDSAVEGINQRLTEGLGLTNVRPLIPSSNVTGLGSGRVGDAGGPMTLADFLAVAKSFFQIERLQFVGSLDREVRRVAIGCGSAGQFLSSARDAGCDTFLTGETSFHTCLEAQASGISLVLPGHYATERFAVEQLAVVLANRFADADVWCSRSERDPVDAY